MINTHEADLVRSLNTLFADRYITAIAYRVKQARYTGQTCDICVDSLDRRYYLAIECKSVIGPNTPKLNFKHHFHEKTKADSQVRRITDFINASGRTGYLALELRKVPKQTHPKQTESVLYMIPWPIIREHWERGAVSMDINEISMYSFKYRKTRQRPVGSTKPKRLYDLREWIRANQERIKARIKEEAETQKGPDTLFGMK